MSWQPRPQGGWVAEANRGELPEYEPTPAAFDAERLIDEALERAINPDASLRHDAVEPLTVFCNALETEANLTPLGRWATQRYINRLLDEHLVLDGSAGDPDVVTQVVEAPIFVVGPPRSGTTALHRLLALDPSHRVTEGWEVLFPSRAGVDDESNEAAKAAASDELGFPQSVAEGIRSIHTYSATMPKECLSAMALSFRTEEFISRYNVPSYVEWLQSADMAPAYAMHRLVLQVLQSRQTAPSRWVLKSPVHLQSLPDLALAYPDARLVVTHRKPADFLASVSSLLATLRSAFSTSVDAEAIGRYHFELYRRSLAELADQLERGPIDAARIVHVYHADITRNPGSVIRHIYNDLGLQLPAELDAIRPEDREDGVGAHQYDPADFGLDEGEVRDGFETYRDRFGLD